LSWFLFCVQFKKGLVESGVHLSEEHLQALFRHFDADCTGQLSFDEFSAGVRPPMSQRRKKLVLAVRINGSRCHGLYSCDYLRVSQSSRACELVVHELLTPD
jgi:hypothetical protein